jgi:hypothetical protein
MKWLLYLRLALAIIGIIKELQTGQKVDGRKVIKVVENVLPEKIKANLALLTPEDVQGVQDAFLTLGTLFDDKEKLPQGNG